MIAKTRRSIKKTVRLFIGCIGLSAMACPAGGLQWLTPLQIPVTPSARVAENLPISDWYFLSTEIDAKGQNVRLNPAEPIHYLENKDIPDKAREPFAKLHPGVTRAAVVKTWAETGGLTPCQFLLLEKGGGPDFLAVRIEWRPAAMPERIFADRNLRLRWIRRNAPLPAPDDIAMRISRPYLARYVLD